MHSGQSSRVLFGFNRNTVVKVVGLWEAYRVVSQCGNFPIKFIHHDENYFWFKGMYEGLCKFSAVVFRYFDC